jgi:hypothetical protein
MTVSLVTMTGFVKMADQVLINRATIRPGLDDNHKQSYKLVS